MTAPVAPWPALAVRAYLLGAAQITDVVGTRVSTRSPDDVGKLHVVVQSPTAPGLDRVAYGLHRPLVVVEARGASTPDQDPEDAVMGLAAVLSAVLTGARNVAYEKSRWTARGVSGAFALPVDDTRGVPVFRGATQAAVTLHART